MYGTKHVDYRLPSIQDEINTGRRSTEKLDSVTAHGAAESELEVLLLAPVLIYSLTLLLASAHLSGDQVGEILSRGSPGNAGRTTRDRVVPSPQLGIRQTFQFRCIEGYVNSVGFALRGRKSH